MPRAKRELMESLNQFVAIWKLIGKPFPNVDQIDKPGLAITWPNTEFPFYNALFLNEELTEASALRERVQEASAYMRACEHGGLFVVCLDSMNGSAKEQSSTILSQAGFV